jgi:ectoine hydroxylase-related dioxygenase (phytanoyl-CoA dioxygenase family)
MLTSDQITSYRDQGYLVIEDALEPAQLQKLQEVTYDFIEQSRAASESNEVFDLDEGHSADRPRLTRIKQPVARHPIFWEILRSERITGFLKPLLGPDIRLGNSKLNTKAPGGGAAVEWHQDWAFYPHTNDDLLAIGLLLEDTGDVNGPLMVIPGSHKGPMLDHHANGVFCGAIDPQDRLFEKDKAVTLTGKAGTMTIHHARTLHGSAPNHSDRARLLLLYELAAADAWPLSGVGGLYVGKSQEEIWDLFNERLVCGVQTVRPRLRDVPVVMPLPPAPDSSSIFKTQKSGRAVSAFAA